MYTYEGFEYTDEEVQQAANNADLSIEDYINKNNITLKDEDPEPKKVKGAAQGVVAGPQMPQEITPGFMPQPVETPKSTELVSEDISLDSQDPKSENTYIAKSTEPKKPNKRKTNILFNNKNINYSGLEQLGFEIKEKKSMSNMRLGAITRINITAPNGETGVFNKNKGFEELNNFIQVNGTEESISEYKKNKSNRNNFKKRIKQLYGLDYQLNSPKDLYADPDVYNDLKNAAIESYNSLNIDQSTQGNMFGFGGATALENSNITEYQIDKIMQQAVGEMIATEKKQLDDIKNKRIAEQIEKEGLVPEDYLKIKIKQASDNMDDPNLKKLVGLQNNIEGLRKKINSTPAFSVEGLDAESQLEKLESQASIIRDDYTKQDSGYWLDFENLKVEKNDFEKSDDNNLNISDKVNPILQRLLNIKKDSKTGAMSVEFLRYTQETEDLEKELNTLIDVSKKQYGGKATIGEMIDRGRWVGDLSQYMLKKDAEEGVITGQQFDNFKNIKVEDIIKMFITSKGFLRQGFGEDIKGVPAGYKPDPDKAAITTSYDSAYFMDLTDRYLNNLAEKKAFEIAFLANINPADLKRTGFFGALGTSFAESFTSPEQVELNLGSTNSEVLAKIQEIGEASSDDPKNFFDEDQKNNFKETLGEFTGSVLGQGPRLAVEFGIANAISGGVLGYTGLARYINTLKTGKFFKGGKQISAVNVSKEALKGGTKTVSGGLLPASNKLVREFVDKSDDLTRVGGGILDRAKALTIESFVESAKMTGVFGEEMALTGFLFPGASKVVGTMFKAVPSFVTVPKSMYHRVNELIIKPGRSGVSLLGASELASVNEALIDDMIGRDDFKTFVDENFLDLPGFGEDGINRRLLSHFLTGKSLAYAHVNWSNVKSTVNSAKNMNASAYKAVMEISKDAGSGGVKSVTDRVNKLRSEKSLTEAQQQELISKTELLNKFDKQISLYNLSKNYLDAASRGNRATNIAISREEIKREENRVKAEYKKANGENLNLKVKIVDDGVGLNGKNAEYNKNKDGTYEIKIDSRKYKKGVILHELSHMYADIYNVNSVEGMGEIRKFLESTVKEQLGVDIFKQIQGEYAKKKQESETFNEEYVMALIEKLGNGGGNLIRNNGFSVIKNKLQNLFNRSIAKVKGEKQLLDINTPEQLLNVLQSIATGKNMSTKFKALQNLTIQGNRIFNAKTSKAVGAIGGIENSIKVDALLKRQEVLQAKSKRTESEEKEFNSNASEIKDIINSMYGKKASIELEEFERELEDKLWSGEIDEYEMQSQLSNFKAKQGKKKKEVTKPKKEVDLDEVIVSDTKLDELAIKFQKTPEEVSREEKQDLQNQYTKLAVNSLYMWAYGGGRKVPIKEAMKDPEIKQEIIQEISIEFNSVMKNYKAVNPETGVAQKLSTYIGNTVARRVGPKVVEKYARDLQNVSMSSGVGEGFTSSETSDQGFSFEERGVSEGMDARKIDPLKFDITTQKAVELNDAVFPELTKLQKIENKTPEDEANIEAEKTRLKETVTTDYIKDNLIGSVGEILFDVPSIKFTKTNVAVRYAEPVIDGVKQISEARKVQNYFQKGQNTKKFLEILPEFNVARTEAETSNPLETILVSSDVKGRSILKDKNIKDFLYEPYIDPRSKTDKERAVTDPSGRSKGKTVQTKVVRLKPEFRGNISNESIAAFQLKMGITPSGEINIPPAKRVNGKDLRSIEGRFILGAAKTLATLTANKIVRNKIEGFETTVPKEVDQLLADIKSATSERMASLELDAFIKKFVVSQGYRDIRQYVSADQEIKTITNEIAKNIKTESYLNSLKKANGLDMEFNDLLTPLTNTSSGAQTFSHSELVKYRNEQRKFAEFLPKEFSQIRGLSGYILGRQYRADLTGFKNLGKEDAIKKVVNEKGEEMFIDQLGDIMLPTTELNKLLDIDISKDKYSFETKKLAAELNEILEGETLESMTNTRTKTLKTNLKKAQKSQENQLKIIKKAVNDTKNNKARNVALNLLNSLKVDYVQSTKKGSEERKQALVYMTRLAVSTSNIHFGEKSLVEIVGGVTGKGEFYLEHLDTATKTGLRGLDNIYFGTNNKLQSRAMLVPKSFAQKLDKKVSKTSMNGMLRLIPFTKTNNILIKNNKGRVVKFKEYLTKPETWTINDLKAHDQQVKESREEGKASLDLNKTFNKIIEGKTGIKADDVYSKSRGSKAGKGKGRFDIIPPSAEDFVGLLYKTLGKGKEGDAQMDFYKKHLIDPFARGDEAITNERNALMRDFKQVKKEIVESIGGTNWKGVSPLTKKLKNKIGDQDYTGEDAVRMYIWRKQGMEIPEIDKAEVDAAISSLAKDPVLVDFANKIRTINRGRPYTAPEKGWTAGNIATDFLSGINTEGRAKHLEEWQANVDAVFSKENLNKLEGAFGTSYRKAMEDMLRRMKSGKNRDVSKDQLSGRVTDWVNNSTGAIMFFNQRSAVLQLMSATNFVNMTDNNIFKAGTAFANQPQYWKDFKTLFNSEYLKNRRGGLEFNVTESEIADLAKQGGARGVISKILKIGFTPTQIADSFAIASGGATFFRNRFKTYLNETNAEGEKVYTEKEAKEKAFLDFKETAEESQQSSRPDKISQQQASNLGRLVLSFANTPSQYARIIKKATLDLKDGRGDKKTNISKIAYYTFLTNLVFNGLQKALFTEALANTDDDEKSDAKKRKEQEKRQSKYLDVANGMISSYLRGTGVRGNVISTLKDMGLEVYKQQGKTVQDYDRVADAALGFSPPLRYKYIQMKSAGRKFTYPGSREEITDKGFSIDNPALMAGAQYTSALTNVPLDRALKKINNIVLATNSELEEIQRIGLVLGWSAWDLGIEKPKKKRRSSSKKRKSSIKKSSIKRSTIK